MSEATKRRVKHEVYVSCKSCGKTSPTFILERANGVGFPGRAMCPKCSKSAYVHNILGLWKFMEEACAEIARLNLDVMDLQSADDEAER